VSGLAGLEAAAGGSLCVRCRRLPEGFPANVGPDEQRRGRGHAAACSSGSGLEPISPTEGGVQGGFRRLGGRRPAERLSQLASFIMDRLSGMPDSNWRPSAWEDRDWPKVTLTYTPFRGLDASTCFRRPRLSRRKCELWCEPRAARVRRYGSWATTGPNQLWVANLTHVAIWASFVYVAFVIGHRCVPARHHRLGTYRSQPRQPHRRSRPRPAGSSPNRRSASRWPLL
jgi:hypothetical protein